MAKGQMRSNREKKKPKADKNKEKSRAGGVAVYAGLAYYREDQEIILI